MKSNLNKVLLSILFFIIFTCCVYGVNSLNIRKPVNAGKFYPSNKMELENMLKEFFNSLSTKSQIANLEGVIVPHAGYNYSGKVAAEAYKQIDTSKFDTVVIIGPSHYLRIKNILISNSNFWETPLGRIKINNNIVKNIENNFKDVELSSSKFYKEHSIEVQLPFLQYIFKRPFEIVPVMVNDKKLSSNLSRILFYLDKNYNNILFVFTTDMSHFHNYEKANKIDNKTIKLITNKNNSSLKENLNNNTCELCGEASVLSAMEFSIKSGYNLNLVEYKNSGDITQNKDRVVGYGSFLIESSAAEKEKKISPHLKDRILEISRETLDNYVKNNKIPDINIHSSFFKKKRGLFITLRTKNGELRGCLGRIYPTMKLYEGIQKMTVASATRDPRFSPVSEEELDNIIIEVSILSKPKKVNNIEEIELGKHGVIIKKNNRSGVFLPQVAGETGWSKIKFLEHLCRDKAGLNKDAWKSSETEIYIFTAEVFNEKE
ncbi:MAG: AmmeMemoRadiSam system protein B [Candidatus Mcinerneyibacterium aminivorans]|uniref:MEMO1 family protein FXF47_04100 n=1 Tax=Candidatus Mcinerneyibacterium aminivorans TaxID=2703815 RepID=A0A5D0MJY1_9BACT|nr:MAG: AmmeMemoRadiSam system protein B [Candidatus Mcinerneyibacterium aminivorans]